MGTLHKDHIKRFLAKEAKAEESAAAEKARAEEEEIKNCEKRESIELQFAIDYGSGMKLMTLTLREPDPEMVHRTEYDSDSWPKYEHELKTAAMILQHGAMPENGEPLFSEGPQGVAEAEALLKAQLEENPLMRNRGIMKEGVPTMKGIIREIHNLRDKSRRKHYFLKGHGMRRVPTSDGNGYQVVRLEDDREATRSTRNVRPF